MKYNELVEFTVLGLNEERFESLKKLLLDKYIFFSIVESSEVTEEILSEKICDYFEKVKLKTSDSLDKQVKNFCKTLDAIVSSKISKVTKANPTPSRARRYYDHIKEIPRKKELTVLELLDYCRVMFCLYNAIIDHKGTEIANFDYTLSTIKTTKILDSFIKEQNNVVKKFKGFLEYGEVYTSERGILVLLIIILNKILDREIIGDYYHG